MSRSARKHQYNIDGNLSISSTVELPELKFFKAEQGEPPNLVIEVAAVGGVLPRAHCELTADASGLIYREHLGALAANFRLQIGSPMRVSVGPLLALSPHVLYTNVVEPLLRFLLVRRGLMLLHAACIVVEGQAIMLSARTDTGKTSTILTLLRRHGGIFYSDDMVIISKQGIASRYPKPLTISAHTLRSVPEHRLALSQRVALSLQSRLHSREGRAVGRRMGDLNLPIMAINAGVQMLIPPPKYMITELVDCPIGDQVPIRDLYLIERGRPSLVASVERTDAMRELMSNTDDAYGFPPYAELAPRLVIDGEGFEELRSRERSILTAALRAAQITRLRVDDFSWPEIIYDQSCAKGRPGVSHPLIASRSLSNTPRAKSKRKPGARPPKVNAGRSVVHRRSVERQGEAAPVPRSRTLHWAAPVRSLLQNPDRQRTLGRVILLATLATACLLRFWDLNQIGFRGDEAVYAGQAAVLAGVHSLDRHFILISRGNSNFLLFQSIVSIVYRVVGLNDLAPRVVAALFSSLTVLVTIWIARILYDELTTWLAALLMALSSYAVSFGRLALLDSTNAFFFAVAMLCLVKWQRTQRRVWIFGMAASTSLAIQAKLVGVLILPIGLAYLVLARSFSKLRWRDLAAATAIFLACLLPAWTQLAQNQQQFFDLLAHSTRRTSTVPWYYYVLLLIRYEGPIMPAAWTLGVLLAFRRRSPADLLPLIWLAVAAAFFQIYPLKAYNYLLPLIPPMTLLGARALSAFAVTPLWRVAAAGAAAAALTILAVPSLHATLADDNFGGLKEAAQWLAQNSPGDAGVMTMSAGSAQYVFSFYSGRDSYPYGRFQLATVLPGGTVVPPTTTDSASPRDWVSFWPDRLIESGTVSYLVYYTNNPSGVAVDDEPSTLLDQSARQRMFKGLIERHGGELIHTVYRHHAARVWIYRVTKPLVHPVLAHTVQDGSVTITGWGFARKSPVTVSYYHQPGIAHTQSGADSSVSTSFPLPPWTRSRLRVIVTDAGGNYASFTGLPRPSIAVNTVAGVVTVTGSGFAANSPVQISYHKQQVARVQVDERGWMSASFPLPPWAHAKYRLIVSGEDGIYASFTGVPRASVTYAVQGGVVRIWGSNVPAGSLLAITYHGTRMAEARAGGDGTFAASFPLPWWARPRYRLIVASDSGRYSVFTHLVEPSIWYRLSGGMVTANPSSVTRGPP